MEAEFADFAGSRKRKFRRGNLLLRLADRPLLIPGHWVDCLAKDYRKRGLILPICWRLGRLRKRGEGFPAVCLLADEMFFAQGEGCLRIAKNIVSLCRSLTAEGARDSDSHSPTTNRMEKDKSKRMTKRASPFASLALKTRVQKKTFRFEEKKKFVGLSAKLATNFAKSRDLLLVIILSLVF